MKYVLEESELKSIKEKERADGRLEEFDHILAIIENVLFKGHEVGGKGSNADKLRDLIKRIKEEYA